MIEKITTDNKEILKVYSSRGFYYEVEITHYPHLGYALAQYQGAIIGQCDLYRMNKPYSDNDYEWEKYEEAYLAWREEILENMKYICTNYFNTNER